MTNTSDGFHVSQMTHMCQDHSEEWANLAAACVDAISAGADTARELAELHQFLEEGRATCLLECGRGEQS